MKSSAVLAVFLAAVLVLGCVSPPSVGVSSTTLGKSQPDKGTLAKPPKDGSSMKEAEVSKPPASNDADSSCGGIKDQRLRNICFRDSAVKAGTAALCDRIDQVGVKDDCLYKVASNTRDRGICAGISKEAIRDLCRGG